MANFCTNCGAKLDPNAKFCAGCGSSVTRPWPAAQPESTEQSRSFATPQLRVTGRHVPIWGPLVVAAAIILVGALVLLRSHSTSPGAVAFHSTQPSGPPTGSSPGTAWNVLPRFAFLGAYVEYRATLGEQSGALISAVASVDTAAGNMRVQYRWAPPYDKLIPPGEVTAWLDQPAPQFSAFGASDLASAKTGANTIASAAIAGLPPISTEHHVPVSLAGGQVVVTEEIHFPNGVVWVDDLSGLIVKIYGTQIMEGVKTKLGWRGGGLPTLELMNTNIPMQGPDGSLLLPPTAPPTPGFVVIRARIVGVPNSPVATAILRVVPKR